MTHRRLIPAACALALLLITSLPAHASTFFNESFEFADNAAWLAPGTGWVSSSCTVAEHAGIMEISSARSFRGTKSLKFTYIGLNPIKTCFLDRFYTRVSEIYTRRYIFLDNFHGTTPPTKQHFIGSSTYVNFWPTLEGTNNVHRLNMQGSALPYSEQNPIFGSIPSGRWVCSEFRIKMNTPGVPNGVIEEWMDGVLRFSRSDMLINSATHTSSFNMTRLYRQHGNGVIYVDEYAIGTTRIGCLGAPVSDTTPPVAPSNFVAN